MSERYRLMKNEDMESERNAALRLVADIRAAVGDPDGKLMQSELIAYCAEMLDRVTRAEVILDRLSSGYWQSVLDQDGDDEKMADQVMGYWRKYNQAKQEGGE